MTRTESNDQLGMVALDRAECLRLLGRGVIGRVVYTDGALPAAQPVNYTVEGEEIIFRTGGGSKLAAATNNAVVAFEVDDVDVDTHAGWSVLAIGKAYPVTDIDRLRRFVSPLPRPWVSGRTAHTIAIPTWRLTGRRLSATVPDAIRDPADV